MKQFVAAILLLALLGPVMVVNKSFGSPPPPPNPSPSTNSVSINGVVPSFSDSILLK
jgi:hypothetical protein